MIRFLLILAVVSAISLGRLHIALVSLDEQDLQNQRATEVQKGKLQLEAMEFMLTHPQPKTPEPSRNL